MTATTATKKTATGGKPAKKGAPKLTQWQLAERVLGHLPDDGKTIRKFVTHHKPHLDEILAIFLLKVFGRKRFPGIEKAKIEFWGMGQKTPDGRKLAEHIAEGTLPIGVAGSPFDEHQKGKSRECAAMLVAKFLGVRNDPRIARLLNYTLKEDRGSDQAPRHYRDRDRDKAVELAGEIKIYGQSFEDDQIVRWAMEYLTAYFQNRKRFYEQTSQAFKQFATATDLPGPKGTRRLVAVDLPEPADEEQRKVFEQLHRYAMAKERADVVILRQASGQTQIFFNSRKRNGLNFDEVARAIRLKEQIEKKKAGKLDAILTYGWKRLAVEGQVAGAECWHYVKAHWRDRRGREHEMGTMLLNGSRTATDIEPTILTLKQVVHTITMVMDVTQYLRDEKRCRTGSACNPPDHVVCPWYYWGLSRCFQCRRDAHDTRTKGNKGRPKAKTHGAHGGNGRNHGKPARAKGPLTASVGEVAAAHTKK